MDVADSSAWLAYIADARSVRTGLTMDEEVGKHVLQLLLDVIGGAVHV